MREHGSLHPFDRSWSVTLSAAVERIIGTVWQSPDLVYPRSMESQTSQDSDRKELGLLHTYSFCCAMLSVASLQFRISILSRAYSRPRLSLSINNVVHHVGVGSCSSPSAKSFIRRCRTLCSAGGVHEYMRASDGECGPIANAVGDSIPV